MTMDIEKREIDAGGGRTVTVYTVLSGKYRIWKDLMGFHRWCIDQWPDDGIGIKSHGSSMTIEGAVEACKRNYAFRREYYERT